MKQIIQDLLAVIHRREKKSILWFITFNTVINLVDICAVVFLLFVVRYYTQHTAHQQLLPGIYFQDNSLVPVVLLIVLFALKNMAGHLVFKKQVGFLRNVAVRISKQNLADYLDGTYADYANIDSAVFTSRIINQPTEFAQFVLNNVQQIITELIFITFSVTALMFYNARLFVIVTLTLLPAVVVLGWLNKGRLEKIKKNIKPVTERSLQYLGEALRGYVESNIYNKNAFFVNRHEQIQYAVQDSVVNMRTTQDIPSRFFEIFAILGLFVLIVTARLGPTAGIDVVLIGAFIAAAYKIIPSIAKILTLSTQIKVYQYAIHSAIRKVPEVKEQPREARITSIKLSDVHFGYKNLEVLNGFNGELNAGMFVGIKGNSGKGKTTLLQLILGFYEESSGQISINNEVLNANQRAACRGRVAYVKQEPFILHDSILNNIVLFEERYDSAKLDHVLKVTGADRIAGQFTGGINADLMEAGKNLSGGQRKRIAIARALYKDADVLLLDEPFSELDDASVALMLEHLQQLAQQGRMVVLISHHADNFKYCDAVIHLS